MDQNHSSFTIPQGRSRCRKTVGATTKRQHALSPRQKWQLLVRLLLLQCFGSSCPRSVSREHLPL
jgi:hypothetical protein